MADNSLVNTASADAGAVNETYATDDIGGVKYPRSKIVVGADGVNGGDVSAANPLPVKITDGTNSAAIVMADGGYGLTTVTPGHISTANSTTATLGAGATFTGTWEDIVNHGAINVSVIASHASAASGFVVQYSSDGVNVDNTDAYTIPAATGKLYSFQCGARYFRVVYTNGGTIQTYFRLQTILRPFYVKPSSHRVGDQVSLEDDAELGKSIIAGETTAGGGSMVNVKVNPSGALTVESTITGTVTVAQATASNLKVDLSGTGANATAIKVDGSAVTQPVSGTVTINTVPAGTNYIGKVRITDGTNDTTLRSLTSSKALDVSIVDGSGNQITGFGGTQFAEDAAHVSGDIGTEILAVRRDTPTVGTSANGDYSTISVDKFGRVQTVDPLGLPGSVDTFGNLITGQRNNQVDIQFFRGTPGSLVTVTNTGSGGATSSGGGAVFATGATATSSSKGVTAATTYYSSGGEVFAQFSAAFPTAGAASSFMRIGLYDDNNGMFIGYEAATFGITTRKATVDTQVAKASWNVDTLTGAASSKFTRNGVPEAIDLSFANVWRVRFGWLGEAPIVFEVMSPDGEWVVFHVIKQPNTTAAASINNPELPMTCHVSKTAGATDYSIVTYCWGAGCTVAQRRANDSLTVSTIMPATRAIIAGETTAGGGGLVNVKVTPSGAVATSFNATIFDVNTTITRPADTNVYAVGDAITDSTSAPTTASVSSVGSGNTTAIEIDSVIVTSSVKGASLPYLRLFIGNSAITATNDNSAFALTDSENDAIVAQIDMGAPYSATNNARLERHDLNIVCNTSSTNTLTLALVADSAYTPASGEVFKIIIRGKRLA